MNYIPPNIHLFISTRYAVPFNLIRLKTHGFVNEVNYNDIKFSNEEIYQFFNVQGNSYFTKEVINMYETETDGWAVALSLIKKASEVNMSEREFMKWGTREDIYAYFMEEVFQQIPLEIQNFLICTSVLDVLTPEICNVLTKRMDSEKIIQNILSQNIFLISYEADETYYRYHHLFKEFLQKRLGDEKKSLFMTVGEYCEHRNRFEEAIENYLLSEAYENASILIDNIGIKMIKDGKWQTVNRWMQGLPMELKERSPVFIFLEADMYNRNGLWDEALTLINKVIELYNQRGSIKDWMISRFQKAVVLRRAGHLKESLDELNKTISEVEELPFIDWYELVLEKVNTLLWSSDLNEAVQTLKRGIEFGRRDGEHRLLGYFMENLGATYYAKGEYRNAMAYYNVSKEEYLTEKDSLSEIEKERYSQRTTLSAIF